MGESSHSFLNQMTSMSTYIIWELDTPNISGNVEYLHLSR